MEVMYGMVVDGNGAASVVLYADSEHERNEWVLLFEKSTDSGRFVTDLYAIDFNHPLGW